MWKLLAVGAVGVQGIAVPTIELEKGVYFPMVGLGTWQYNNTQAQQAVAMALDMGYDMIDTANVYGNQVGIGAALKASKRLRSSYFITTKINGGLDFDGATAALNQNIQQLGVDYVDLTLTHFPASWDGKGGKAMRQAGWKALEAFKKAGKTKSIGVSHYCKSHMEDILEINTTAIALNQVEYHIGMIPWGDNSTDYMEYDRSVGVTYMSFSTLCGPCGTNELVNGPLVTGIGAKYGKTGAQVSLKWAVQQGIPVVPKSIDPGHLAENLDLFGGWELSDDDMKVLSSQKSPVPAGGGGIQPPASGDCVVV
jgi:diketogulonate reductase-like aldo/keto reductase